MMVPAFYNTSHQSSTSLFWGHFYEPFHKFTLKCPSVERTTGTLILIWQHYLILRVSINMSSEGVQDYLCYEGARCMCNELRVIWPVPHEILSVITRSTIIT